MCHIPLQKVGWRLFALHLCIVIESNITGEYPKNQYPISKASIQYPIEGYPNILNHPILRKPYCTVKNCPAEPAGFFYVRLPVAGCPLPETGNLQPET